MNPLFSPTAGMRGQNVTRNGGPQIVGCLILAESPKCPGGGKLSAPKSQQFLRLQCPSRTPEIGALAKSGIAIRDAMKSR